MSRAITGSLVGAGGATAYFSGIDFTRFLPRGSWDVHQQPWQGRAGQEVEDLRRLVEQLSRNLASGPTTVVIPGQQNRSNNGVLLISAAAAAGFIYVRVWRGWNIGDLMYVTKASLQETVGLVTAGVEQVRDYVLTRIPLLQQRVDGLDRKQDEVLQGQEDLQNQVSDVHSSITTVQSRLQDMEQSFLLNQDYANQGIHLLCKVVGDLVRGGNAASRQQSLQDLDRFVRHPRSLASNVSGFETLLAPEDSRFRIMRQSSATVGGIKAVPDQLQLEASEKAAAQQLRAGQSERHRPQRSTC